MTTVVSIIKVVLSAVIGTIAYWLGGIDELLISLIVITVLDYVTGIAKAIHNKNLSSEVGMKGIIKKVLLLIIVAVAFVIENLIGNMFPLREFVIVFFICNEAISILENVAQTGVKIPEKLKEILLQLREHGKPENEDKE